MNKNSATIRRKSNTSVAFRHKEVAGFGWWLSVFPDSPIALHQGLKDNANEKYERVIKVTATYAISRKVVSINNWYTNIEVATPVVAEQPEVQPEPIAEPVQEAQVSEVVAEEVVSPVVEKELEVQPEQIVEPVQRRSSRSDCRRCRFSSSRRRTRKFNPNQ